MAQTYQAMQLEAARKIVAQTASKDIVISDDETILDEGDFWVPVYVRVCYGTVENELSDFRYDATEDRR